MARRTGIEGLDKLKDAAHKAAEAARKSAEATIRTEVETVRSEMRRDVPVDSGQLRDSIRGRASGLEGEVRATARHSIFVEFGTSDTPAQPYAFPAAARARARLPKRLAESIRTAVERKR